MTNADAVLHIIQHGHRAWIKDGFVWGVRGVTIRDDQDKTHSFDQLKFLGKNPTLASLKQWLEN